MGWFGRDKKSSPGSENKPVELTTEETIRKLLADGEAAKKIVNDYGGVLEITSNMMYGAPQSLLPRPKGEIKQAIKMYLLYLHVTETLDEKWFNLLEVGYAQLSSFPDDTDAKVAVAAQADFNAAVATARGVPNSKDIVRMAERMASPNFSAALERSKKSTEESKTLSEEFNAVAAKLGIQFAKPGRLG